MGHVEYDGRSISARELASFPPGRAQCPVAAHTARLALPAQFAEEACRDGMRARIAVKEMVLDRGSTRVDSRREHGLRYNIVSFAAALGAAGCGVRHDRA